MLLLRDPRQRQQRQQPCGGRHRSARLGPARRRRCTGLDHAAEIDGCSTLRIFGQIIVPLMMPAVATVAVLGFMHAAGAGLRNARALHVPVVVADRGCLHHYRV